MCPVSQQREDRGLSVDTHMGMAWLTMLYRMIKHAEQGEIHLE